ncbi:tetratricopeptide repeat protein [Myxococcota bacterium]|nr:tetratricopeptide repeat protein [Myxococcota bacterium]
MKTTRLLSTFAPATLALVLCSCQRAPQDGRPVPQDRSSPEARAKAALEELKVLALAPSPGGSKVDARITELAAQAARTPDKVDTWILLGRAWVQKARLSADPGYYLHADAAAQVALALKPEYPLALGLRGLVMMNDHRFAEARELARSVLARDPEELTALGVLADAELELGDLEASAAATQRMIDLKPNLPSYSRAAYVRWLTGDVREAKRIMWLAIDAGRDQRDPEPGAWAIVEAAKIFLAEGDYPGAEAGFDRALQRLPSYPPALLGKARAALAQGRASEAAPLAKQSFEASRLAEAAWVWGEAERAAGRDDRASEAFTAVVQTGRQGDKRTLAAFFAEENRDLDEALRTIEGELRHRGDVYSHDAHAWALHRLGRHAEAKAASDRALVHGTRDPVMLFHAGAIRVALGETSAGLDRVREALRLGLAAHPAALKEAKALVARHGLAAR